MRRTTMPFHQRVSSGKKPELYVVVHTHMGARVYSGETLAEYFTETAPLANGQYFADGTLFANGGSASPLLDSALSKESRIQKFGRLQRSLAPRDRNLYAGLASKQQARFSIEMQNSDRAFTLLLAKEPFITRPVEVWLGYEDTPTVDHLCIWRGLIDEVTVTTTSVTLLAVEA